MTYAKPIQIADNKREKYAVRFWSKVLILGPDECWPWQAGKDRDGYGKIGIQGRTLIASRVAYCLTYGKDPSECARHTCDNPPCCNPAHLKSATYTENNHDMMAKGRARLIGGTGLKPASSFPKGSKHPSAKLTENDVRTIRQIYAEGERNLREIGARFGVKANAVRGAIRGETWKHVT